MIEVLRHRWELIPFQDVVVCVQPERFASVSRDSCHGCGERVTMEEVATLPPECRLLPSLAANWILWRRQGLLA